MTDEKKQEETEKNTPSLKDQAAQQEQVSPQEQKPLDQPQDKEENPNWRAFREARKKDRLDKEAAERRAREKEEEAAALKAAMESAFAKQPHNYYNQGGQIEQQDPTEEQRIERLVNQAIERKQSEFERTRQEIEKREMPTRLRQNYTDFNETVTADNLDYL